MRKTREIRCDEIADNNGWGPTSCEIPTGAAPGAAAPALPRWNADLANTVRLLGGGWAAASCPGGDPAGVLPAEPCAGTPTGWVPASAERGPPDPFSSIGGELQHDAHGILKLGGPPKAPREARNRHHDARLFCEGYCSPAHTDAGCRI